MVRQLSLCPASVRQCSVSAVRSVAEPLNLSRPTGQEMPSTLPLSENCQNVHFGQIFGKLGVVLRIKHLNHPAIRTGLRFKQMASFPVLGSGFGFFNRALLLGLNGRTNNHKLVKQIEPKRSAERKCDRSKNPAGQSLQSEEAGPTEASFPPYWQQGCAFRLADGLHLGPQRAQFVFEILYLRVSRTYVRARSRAEAAGREITGCCIYRCLSDSRIKIQCSDNVDRVCIRPNCYSWAPA